MSDYTPGTITLPSKYTKEKAKPLPATPPAPRPMTAAESNPYSSSSYNSNAPITLPARYRGPPVDTRTGSRASVPNPNYNVPGQYGYDPNAGPATLPMSAGGPAVYAPPVQTTGVPSTTPSSTYRGSSQYAASQPTLTQAAANVLTNQGNAGGSTSTPTPVVTPATDPTPAPPQWSVGAGAVGADVPDRGLGFKPKGR